MDRLRISVGYHLTSSRKRRRGFGLGPGLGRFRCGRPSSLQSTNWGFVVGLEEKGATVGVVGKEGVVLGVSRDRGSADDAVRSSISAALKTHSSP